VSCGHWPLPCEANLEFWQVMISARVPIPAAPCVTARDTAQASGATWQKLEPETRTSVFFFSSWTTCMRSIATGCFRGRITGRGFVTLLRPAQKRLATPVGTEASNERLSPDVDEILIPAVATDDSDATDPYLHRYLIHRPNHRMQIKLAFSRMRRQRKPAATLFTGVCGSYESSLWPRNSLALATSLSHFPSCSGFRNAATR